MTDFLSFAITIGTLFCGIVVISAWLFRTSSAPIIVKIVLPSGLLWLAIYTPFAFAQFLGLPIPTTIEAMPDNIELIAFKPVNDEKQVDLWINEKGSTRSYEIVLDKVTKSALKKARGEIAEGRPVILSKGNHKNGNGKKSNPSGMTDIQSDDHVGYYLDESIQPSLPPKD